MGRGQFLCVEEVNIAILSAKSNCTKSRRALERLIKCRQQAWIQRWRKRAIQAGMKTSSVGYVLPIPLPLCFGGHLINLKLISDVCLAFITVASRLVEESGMLTGRYIAVLDKTVSVVSRV